MTFEDLMQYVGGDDSTFIAQCWAEADLMVSVYVAGAFKEIPQEILDRATLEVGAELYNRKNAPNGIQQFASFDGQSAVRIARDPMQAAYAILKPYVVIGL